MKKGKTTRKILKNKDKKTGIRYSNFLLIAILLLTAFLYSNSLRNNILNFDDVEYFFNYPEIRNLSWESILKYFSNYYVIMYQPLPVLSFAINYQFTGLETFPMHLVNLCFHLANILVVFHFIKLLSNKTNIALLITLLFAIHPMNVEAVSWISARSSSMYTFFYLLALVNYVKYLKFDKKSKYLVYTGLFFIFSLLSKAQAVTLPVVLLLLDYFYNRKLSWQLIAEKIPLFILSFFFGILTLSDKSTMVNITKGMMVSYSLTDTFFMICYSFMFYVYNFFVPASLCAVHVYPPKSAGLLPFQYYIAPLFILAALILLYRFRKNKVVIFGSLLFLATISINIQLIPSRLFIVAERYAYFPYIGLLFILGSLYSHFSENPSLSYNKYKFLLHFVLIMYCTYFSYSIWERNKIWKDDLIFLTDIIEKNPPVPYISRAYGNRGAYYSKNEMIQESVADFGKAIELKPDDARLYINRALGYIKLNRLPEALKDLNKAEELKPDLVLIFSNRAFIKFNLKDFDGALSDCDKCINLNSTIPETYNIRSAIEYIHNEYNMCEKDLNKAITLKPNFAEAYKNRGILYLKTNRKELACNDWHKSASLGNKDANTLLNKYCNKVNVHGAH